MNWDSREEVGCEDRAILCFEKAMDLVNSNADERFHARLSHMKLCLGSNLAISYATETCPYS